MPRYVITVHYLKVMNMKANKTIALIPPNGDNINQDFSLNRIAIFLNSQRIDTYLIQVDSKYNKSITQYTKYVITLDTKEDIVSYLKNNKFDLIFHRSWMHRYKFASMLAEEFDNIIFYIKDWHNFPLAKYKFIYKNIEDFEGIERLFKSGKRILSHFTEEQFIKWAKKYNASEEQFMFFPEYCTRENFFKRDNIVYNNKNIKLVMAGTLTPTSEPELVDAKSFYQKIKDITNLSIEVNVVVLKKFYDLVQKEDKYKDYLYEHNFNKYFFIHLGKEMDPSILKGYDFGIFSDTFYNFELKQYPEHYEYAVISRFVLYLEAGLPVIVNKSMKSLSKIVEDNEIGIVFEDEDIKDFNQILDIGNEEYLDMVENVYKFREKYSYNENTMKPILEMLE